MRTLLPMRSRTRLPFVRRIHSERGLFDTAVIVVVGLGSGLSVYFAGLYEPTQWGPVALIALALLLGTIVSARSRPDAAGLLACIGLFALWGWALASTGWAESADQALTYANRALLYAALFALLILTLRGRAPARLLLACATVGILVVALVSLARMLAGTGADLFLLGRLNGPLGYINAQAGFYLFALWPLVALAERSRRAAVCGLAIGLAVLAASLALLGQSRGVLIAVVVSAAVLLVVVPGRERRLWVLLAVGGGVAIASGPLLDVYHSGGSGTRLDEGVVRHAAHWALAGAIAAGVAFAAAVALLGRLSSTEVAGLQLRRLSLGALGTFVAVAAVALAVAVEDPVKDIRDGYRSFTELRTGGGEASNRFTLGSGNRYDYWRVALRQFDDQPLKGVGAGNYDRTYFLERRTTEDIKQPHSIELQTLAELGLVGGAALLLFVASVLYGFWRLARVARTDARARGLAVAAGGIFIAWLTQTSVDWLHLLPGVTGIALCAAAVLTTNMRAEDRELIDGGGLRVPALAAGAVLVAFGAVQVGRATAAEHYRSKAEDAIASNPRHAVERANRSLSLSDQSLPAHYLKAAALARLNSYEAARAVLLAATRLEPHDFVPWGLLGDLAVRRGDLRRAGEYYRRASQLNPQDRGLAQLAQDPRSANARLETQTDDSLAP